MWKEEAGGLWSEAGPAKSMRPYLKNKLKPKGLGAWLKWYFLSSLKALSSIPNIATKSFSL
jgi:hypothetical protein